MGHSSSVVKVSLGYCPSIDDVLRVVKGYSVEVESEVVAKLDESRKVYLSEAKKRRIYGACTGLGGRVDSRGPCGPEGERIVLLEHAAGIGDKAPSDLVRAFLFIRLIQLSKGYAPVRGLIAQRIVDALNNNIIPAIPLWGSVGASGDLAPSAHAFLCIFYGEGETLDGKPCKEALDHAGLPPLKLEVGEALALINNTAWSTALALMGLIRIERALREIIRAGYDAALLIGANSEHYALEAVGAKRLREISEVARMAPQGLGGRLLQAPYSIRCIPQVYGPILSTLRWAYTMILEEACSSTENPLVSGHRVYHACNFHAEAVALASDAAAIAAAVAASAAERILDRLMDSRVTNLPDFLAGEESSVGAMIIQYTAAALAAEARALATPRSVNSIPTSLGQEDHVSMAPSAALRLFDLAGILEGIAAILRVTLNTANALRSGKAVIEEPLYESINRELKKLGFTGPRSGLIKIPPRDHHDKRTGQGESSEAQAEDA